MVSALSLFDVLLRLVVGVGVATLAGASAAWAANRMGDDGPRHDGRLTLNPVPHQSLVALLAAVLFQVIWTAPLAIRLERPGKAGWRAIALPLAVALVLAVTAIIALALRPMALRLAGDQAGLGLASALAAVYHVSIRSALVNLLPIPPLLGTCALTAWSRRRATWWERGWVRWIGAGMVLVLLALDHRTRLLASLSASFAAAFGFTVP